MFGTRLRLEGGGVTAGDFCASGEEADCVKPDIAGLSVWLVDGIAVEGVEF
jgi:hypothetical protein